MARRIIVLGVSTYGQFLLKYLYELEHPETVAVDIDEERINAVTDIVSRPIIGNVKNYELLEQLDVEDADEVVVSVGDLETSLVCILFLKDLHAKRIAAKALNAEHVRILRLLNVDDIVFPEQEIAELSAVRLLYPSIRNRMILSNERHVVEIKAPPKFIEGAVPIAKIKEEYDIDVLMVIDTDGKQHLDVPADYVTRDGDKLVLAGTLEGLRKLEREHF